MRLDDFDKTVSFKAAVVSSARITPVEVEEVRDLVLQVDADPEALACVPGQSIGVVVPGPHAQGHDRHFRLYTVADTPAIDTEGKPRVRLCVKRCNYIDEYNGELYCGIASNFLCDLGAGDRLEITGPYGLPFPVPDNREADLLLIGMGTGIAPFRALVRHLYEDIGDWRGRVRLFHGALSGLELLYRNEQNDDLSQYYDRETFEAFDALSPRPHWADPIAMDYALEQRGEEILDMLERADTHVYLAGREEIAESLDRVLSGLLGSGERWQRRKAELVAGGRWQSLLY